MNLIKNSTAFLAPFDFQIQGLFKMILLQSSMSASTAVKPTDWPEYVDGLGLT